MASSFTLSPIWGAGAQLLDNSGNVLSGGKIYTYYAGTTTPAATWTTPAGNVQNSNPIVANAAGRLSNEIWLATGESYKFVLKDANDVLIATYDNIPTITSVPISNDASSIAYEQGYQVTAGNFTIGATYLINFVGNTNFVAIGAAANVVGLHFVATGVGSGTGTALYSQTVQGKLQQTVSVQDFGAKGDGVTDDVKAFNNAINHMYDLGGGTVYVPDGTYIVGGSGAFFSVIVRQNVYLKGAGRNSTILKLKDGANSRVVQFQANENNMQLSDLTIDGNMANQTTPGIHGLRLQGNANIIVSRLLIKNANGYGIGVAFDPLVQENVSDGRFEDLELTANDLDGFDGKRTARCLFQNIYTHDNGGRGIDIRGSQNIYNNIWAYTNGTGISFRALGNLPSSISTENYVKATNCYAFDNRDVGFFIANNEPPITGFKSEYDLVNCHAFNNVNGGFQHRGIEMQVRYVNCTAKENGAQGFRANSLDSDRTTIGSFVNCRSIDNTSAGFSVDADVGPHVLTNCFANGNATTANQITISAPNCQVTDCVVDGSDGVIALRALSTAENFKIFGGVYTSGSADGVRIDAASPTVIGASFISSAGVALRLPAGTTNGTIIGCDFTNVSSGTKISSAETTTNVISCANLSDAIKTPYVAGSVNSITITPSQSGVAPSISSSGSDADLDLELIPKGVGHIQFGTLVGTADAPISGYIIIKDSGGTLRKLAVIS